MRRGGCAPETLHSLVNQTQMKHQCPDLAFYRENQVAVTRGSLHRACPVGERPVSVIVRGAGGGLRGGVCTWGEQGLHCALLSGMTPWFWSCQIRMLVSQSLTGARQGEEEDVWAVGSSAWRRAGQDARWAPRGLNPPGPSPGSP